MPQQFTVSRNADKFAVRMPDDMRARFADLAKRLHSSMNSVIIQGLISYLDSLEELQILLDANRLLRKTLTETQTALDKERAEVAELKAQLQAQLRAGS